LACPERAELERFVLGHIDGPAVERLEEHLLHCPVCAASLQDLKQEDNLMQVMRDAAGLEQTVNEAPIDELIGRLLHNPPQLSTFAAQPLLDNDPGQELIPAAIGRFQIKRELGRGAFGVVYLATDIRIGRPVALKVPRAERLLTPALQSRFRLEARAGGALDHPNLVPVYDAGEEDGVFYIASAYCPGITLATWIAQQTEPVPFRQAARLVAAMGAAVDHAHRRGVLHRDLKPSNVILETVNKDGSNAIDQLPFIPRVTDFGLAKLLETDADATLGNCQTQSGAIIGTPSYMAPEQAGGPAGSVRPTADIYALGAILYELLAGRPPFRADTVLETLLLVRSEEPLPPGRLRPNIPRDLETVCLKCLEKDPKKRYASAGELVDDLESYLGGRPVKARPIQSWEQALKWARRRPALAALAVVSVTAIFAVLGTVIYANARLQERIVFAEDRRIEAEDQRRQALANLGMARAAVDRMLTQVSEERLAGVPRVDKVRVELLKDALNFYEDFAVQAAADPEVRLGLGRARLLLGRSLGSLGEMERGEQYLRDSLSLLAPLATDHPDSGTYAYERIICETELSRILGTREQYGEEREHLELACQLLETLFARAPERRYRAHLAELNNLLGIRQSLLRQFSEAERSTHKALELVAGLILEDPSNLDYLRRRAVLNSNLGELFWITGRGNEALDLFTQNEAYWSDMAKRFPTDQDHQSKLALTSTNLGHIHAEAGRYTQADQAFQNVVKLRKDLVDANPNVPYQRNQLADAQRELAKLALHRSARLDACRWLDEAVRNHLTVLRQSPNNPEFVRSMGKDWMVFAGLRRALAEHAEEAKSRETFSALFSVTPDYLLGAAATLAQCIPLVPNDPDIPPSKHAEQAASYGAQAVDFLRRALAERPGDKAALARDARFAALQSRSDFQQLLATPGSK
jgi:tetratricopeptide (TPR) repeat protein